MFRRLLVLAIALLLVGCCCKPRCNPCQNRCNPCQPQPCPPPPGGGGGSGDSNCAVWATQDCDAGTAGVQSRDWLVKEIKSRATVSTTISPSERSTVINHCNQYLSDRNCKANFNDGTPPNYPEDCAKIGVSNCGCLMDAYGASTPGSENWPLCITKLGHGH